MAKPTYDLALIKGLMKDKSWILTESARDDVTSLGWDDEDVYDCIVNYLEETHFYKTMEKKPREQGTMNCTLCGGSTIEVREVKKAKYRDEIVEVETTFFRCNSCHEGFVTPQQLRDHSRAVKNEIRKKHGLLPPERIARIRQKLELTQSELEDALGTGPKMVVRWESGKVVQSRGHDNMLRLLESQPSILNQLRQVQQLRSNEQKKYAKREETVAVRV